MNPRLFPVLPLFILLSPVGHAAEMKPVSEEAEFIIYVSGEEIGREKFSIQNSGDSIRSSSTMNFREPGNRRQKVRTETQLNMDNQYLPRTYQVRTNVDGQKATVSVKFVPGQANLEYQGRANPRKIGLLVGDRYVVLDTNVFHHFIFVARLFDFGGDKTQPIEVIIPREEANGILKVRDVGVEKVSVRGKRRELRHLRADSGYLLIDLWIDDQRILYKIALPAKDIEVIRNP